MQRTLIVYYSRTGTTRKLATALADRMKAEIIEIRCDRYRGGFLRYLRAGYDSVRGNLPPVELPQVEMRAYDLVLLGAPIWTSHPALPLRAFLTGRPELPARVGLFFTYGGHSAPDTAIKETKALLPGPLEAELALRNTEVGGAELRDSVAAFVEKLSRQSELRDESRPAAHNKS